MTPPRHRVLYAGLIIIVIAAGLGSRRFPDQLPDFVATYAGDALWAMLVFLLFGFLFPQTSIRKIAASALFFSLLIELSQLYHAPWIDQIRANRLAALVLGHGFLWSDLMSYSVGIFAGALTEATGGRFFSASDSK